MTGGKPITGQFWRYALPSMFSQLLNSFFIIVDGFFVGQNLGDAGLAAINVAWPLVAVIQAASLAIGTGGAVRLATALGRGEEEEALRVRGNTLVLLGLAAALLGGGLYLG
ncbi:MATE family efflux transporter, partial [Allofournierella sp.]